MPPEIAERIAAGLELRRRGKLTAEQDAALRELERRYASAEKASPAKPSPFQLVTDPADVQRLPDDAGRTWETDPRAAGRKYFEESGRGTAAAAVQGLGSAALGLGTPVFAASEMVRSAVKGEPKSYSEAREFARGMQEEAFEQHPKAYGLGFVGGLAGSGSATANVIKKLPAAARSVFSLQAGQTAKNIARLAATGAAASGATAGLQEGVEAVPKAAAIGAVAGPVAGAATAGVVRGAENVATRIPDAATRIPVIGKELNQLREISADNVAVRMLARRFKESKEVIAQRYNEFMQRMGHRPSLAELVTEVEAGRVGQVGARIASAGQILKEGSERITVNRPAQLERAVTQGRRTTTVAEQEAELLPIVEETQQLVGSRVSSTETAQIRRRDRVMDAAMGRIGDQRVRLSDDMRDVIEDADVQSALPGHLRRRINNAIEQGETIGTIDLSVRTWEMMRQALAGKAGAGAGKIYSRLRDKVRDYVSERVPEYGDALQEFGRRTVAAETTVNASSGVTKSAREFADMLRAGREGAHAVSAQVGARVGVRKWLEDQLSGTAQQAQRTMSRLARDNKFRRNLQAALSPTEWRQLEVLAEQYGHRLDIIGGAKVGQRVASGDAQRFEDAVRNASTTPGGATGVRTSARGTLGARAGESPGAAIGTAAAMAEHPGLQQRIAAALGGPEAARLQDVGRLATRSARNLSEATPRQSVAQIEAQEQARAIYETITASILPTGRSSAAMRAHWAQRITERLRVGRGAANRLAQMAIDPDRAPVFINRMKAGGVTSQELLQWYRDAALAAGIATGAQ